MTYWTWNVHWCLIWCYVLCQSFLHFQTWILIDAIYLTMGAKNFHVSYSYFFQSVILYLIISFLGFSFWHHKYYWWHYVCNITFFFTGLENLKVLNLGFNAITDTCLIHLKGDFKSLACFIFLYSSWFIVNF